VSGIFLSDRSNDRAYATLLYGLEVRDPIVVPGRRGRISC
jgi:hypothetical protein